MCETPYFKEFYNYEHVDVNCTELHTRLIGGFSPKHNHFSWRDANGLSQMGQFCYFYTFDVSYNLEVLLPNGS